MPMKQRVNVSFLRDKRLHKVWLVAVLAWACFRAVAINRFFGDHKVNAWGYLIVDLSSSIPYAIYSAKAVITFLDKSWELFRKHVFLTAISFYIPDIYVIIFARTVPTALYIGFGISIIFFTALAFLSLKKDASRGNR